MMADTDDLESLQTLHADLLAASESRLSNVERLWVQLESRIEEFRSLLDKRPRNDQSRQSLTTGKIRVQEDEYGINAEFQQNALEVADALNLDEIDSARLLLESGDDAEALGRSMIECSIIRFHQRRQYLLDCFRIVLQQTAELDPDPDEDLEDGVIPPSAFRNVVTVILNSQGRPGDGSAMIKKCLDEMGNTKAWLQDVADKVNRASVLGQAQTAEIETMEFQRTSLIQQHELLGVIIHYIVLGGHAVPADFDPILENLKRADRYDILLVHVFPAVGAFISTFGTGDQIKLPEARALNNKIISNKEQDQWTMHYVQAAVHAWWIAEYSGRYVDADPDSSPLTNVNLDEESQTRSKQFTDALKDGAFDFLLSLSADVKPSDWVDPARHGLRQWLQRKAPPLNPDSSAFSSAFQKALMGQLESFVDAFITNMPDVLRRLRTDEDEQRQLSQNHEHDLDLERFLVIISYAYDGRPEAAQLFWSDPESNLAGFLHWASRRASTPLMSAFCDMLLSLSLNEECATSAYEFLLDEGPPAAGKIRRNQSLTWGQIFTELRYFMKQLHDKPTPNPSNYYRGAKLPSDQAETEPESAMMLESYLRLISRLCTESPAARTYVYYHPTANLIEILLDFASSSIPSRLRACAFSTLQSLAVRKDRAEGEHLWTCIDAWASGSYTQSIRGVASIPASLQTMASIFQEISSGFEEPQAFVLLLTSLLTPYGEESGLNDSLTFSESLGSSSRMPGIDPYIDFVMEQVFASKNADVIDGVQLRLLRLTCLDFVSTCLSTFNEDLVVLANKSNISVDGAIRTSDLNTYVCLHPFSRVMEWLFNDRVMNVLFQTIHQKPEEIAMATSDSPLVLCVIRAIEVMTLVLDLQSTYLNIVRPIIKMQTQHRSHIVANSAFATFEDGVLNNLSVFADLGLFVGAGHPLLTLASLNLLKRLSTSTKLASPSTMNSGRHITRNKIIAALEKDNEGERIAQSMLNELTSSLEVETGPESYSYMIKVQILDFLLACLETSPDRPSMAHLLLGFNCGLDTVDVAADSPFTQRNSIFHATLDFVADGMIGNENSGVASWLVSLKYKGMKLLKLLWNSSLTSSIVLSELKNNEFLKDLITKEVVISPTTLWDGRVIGDDEFLSSTSAESCANFLKSRSVALQYSALELRQVMEEQGKAAKQRTVLTLSGSTTALDGQHIQHANIFDFFDFMELDFPFVPEPAQLQYLGELDFSMCRTQNEDALATYDLKWVGELILLQQSILRKNGVFKAQPDEQNFENEAQYLETYLRMENDQAALVAARKETLDSWVQVTLMMTESGGLDATNKSEFVLRALQVILPKFEALSLESAEETVQLANLAKMLLFSIDFEQDAFKSGDLAELASDRLYDLFRVCLRAIYSPGAPASVKETLYCICYRYLSGMSDVSQKALLRRVHSIQTIKSAGEKLLEVICDDANAGEATCRVSAVLLLCSFVELAQQDKSMYILESLVRLNFLGFVVESIKEILVEIEQTTQDDVNLQLQYITAKLSLLLLIAQTRPGATAVINGGLFQAVKLSGLFARDPDFGLDISGPKTAEKYYELLLSTTRIINAVILSRGQENKQTLSQGRQFLAENRASVMAVMKREASGGGVEANEEVSITMVEMLAESYMLLICMTGFLDADDGEVRKKQKSMAFT